MASPSLDATVKGANANAYLDRTAAQTFFNNRLNATAWENASNDDKDRALIMATTLVDEQFDWEGEPRTLDQALDWPRSGALDKDGDFLDDDTIPEIVKEAVTEVAIYLLRRNRLDEPSVLGQGFSEAKLGPMSVKVDASQVLDIIPRHVVMKLQEIGDPRFGGKGSFRTVRLKRT